MLIEEVSVSIIIDEIKKYKTTSYYFLDKLFVEYLLKYNSTSIFEDKSFIIRNNENVLYCPVTIEKKNGSKYLNFFGNPFFCIYLKNDINFFISFKEKIKEIFKKENIVDINFVIEKNFPNDLNQNNLILNKNPFNKILNVKYIDLSLTDENIKKGFKKGLKYLLNKDYSKLSYLIIDNTNYNKEVLEMRNMHQEISKKITRTKDTWLINEKMILANKGFLVQVSDENHVISYSLFFNNGQESCYFSSCTYRELYRVYENITHKSIFEAIKYLKSKKCKKLTLGETKIIYSDKIVSDKEKNICMFKSSFGGELVNHYHVNINNFDSIDLYL